MPPPVSTGTFTFAAGQTYSNAVTMDLSTTGATGGTVAAKRRLIRRVYYISDVNALSSRDIQLNGVQAPVTLVENVEQMQIEYAVASLTSKGTAEIFTTTPTTAQLPFVVGARLWIISRSADTSNSSSAAVSFEIGDFTGANAIAYVAATTNPKRRIYSTYIPLTTPKSRLEGKL